MVDRRVLDRTRRDRRRPQRSGAECGIASLRFLAHNHFFIYGTRVHGILCQFADQHRDPDKEAGIGYGGEFYNGSTAGDEAFYTYMSIWEEMQRMAVIRSATRWTLLKALWSGWLTGYLDEP